jgi:hypothetical protein
LRIAASTQIAAEKLIFAKRPIFSRSPQRGLFLVTRLRIIVPDPLRFARFGCSMNLLEPLSSCSETRFESNKIAAEKMVFLRIDLMLFHLVRAAPQWVNCEKVAEEVWATRERDFGLQYRHAFRGPRMLSRCRSAVSALLGAECRTRHADFLQRCPADLAEPLPGVPSTRRDCAHGAGHV